MEIKSVDSKGNINYGTIKLPNLADFTVKNRGYCNTIYLSSDEYAYSAESLGYLIDELTAIKEALETKDAQENILHVGDRVKLKEENLIDDPDAVYEVVYVTTMEACILEKNSGCFYNCYRDGTAFYDPYSNCQWSLDFVKV